MDPNQQSTTPEQPVVAEQVPPADEEQSKQQQRPLSPLATLVIDRFEDRNEPNHEHKITVNPFVSQVATAFEKLRNAMEYREEEVILRATIERILRRRLLLGGTAETTAEPLIRELIWAQYLPDNAVPDSAITRVEEVISLHLQLRHLILSQHRFPVGIINDWTYHLMSSRIEHVLNPNREKQTIANFMYQVLRDDVSILDDTEETRNAQVYLAVRRAFARDDLAFLRFHLFELFFGELTRETLEEIAKTFPDGYKEINKQLSYPRKDKIFTYVKRRSASFFILEDILRKYKGSLHDVLPYESRVKEAVYQTARMRYAGISDKVRRAIIRSVAFILLTKVMFAFAIEGTYERIVYGEILWLQLGINTTIPPLLMVVVSAFIRTPGEGNTRKIHEYIQKLLYEESPRLGNQLVVKKKNDKPNFVFNTLWFLAFVLSFGAISYVLTLLNFNVVSQGIFIFFVTIVSFLSYRISMTAHMYRVGERQDVLTPLIDFLFMPVIRVGRRLSQSISQVNFFLFLFDFLIETPFKLVFAFIEQWFKFLHEKTEDLG